MADRTHPAEPECVCEGEFVWACGPECACHHHAPAAASFLVPVSQDPATKAQVLGILAANKARGDAVWVGVAAEACERLTRASEDRHTLADHKGTWDQCGAMVCWMDRGVAGSLAALGEGA